MTLLRPRYDWTFLLILVFFSFASIGGNLLPQWQPVFGGVGGAGMWISAWHAPRLFARWAVITPEGRDYPVVKETLNIASHLSIPVADVQLLDGGLLPFFNWSRLGIPRPLLDLPVEEQRFAIALSFCAGGGSYGADKIARALSVTGDRAAAEQFFSRLFPKPTGWDTPWEQFLKSRYA